MPRANWDVLIEYPIAVPDDGLLEQFNTFFRNDIDLMHNLIFKNINLRETRDSLLPQLVSGELDVSELDILMEGV